MGDLYRMYDRSNRLLYVGISGHAGTRASQHAEDKPWWPQVARIDIEHLACDRDQLLAYEKRCIQTEQPIYNVQHNARPDFPVEPHDGVLPYFVPRTLASLPEWRDLTRALANLVPLARRRYGAWSLADCVVTAENGDSVDLLGLVAHVARAAHLTTPCSACGADAVPFYVRIEKEGTSQAQIRTSSACTATIPH